MTPYNFRGRRLIVCNAADELANAIDALGVDDGRHLPIPDHDMPEAPSAIVKRELKNQLAALVRLILAYGMLSDQDLKTW